MVFQCTPYVLPDAISGLLLLPMSYLAWRRRHVPGAATLLVLALALMVWCAGNALEIASVDLSSKLFWANVQYPGIVTIPVAWCIFAAQRSGYEKWVTRGRLVRLAVVPVVTLALVWTNDLHGLVRHEVRLDLTGPFPALTRVYGPWFWLWLTYAYTLVLLSTILLLRPLAEDIHLYRRQAVALGGATLLPWIGNALYVFGLSPLYRIDLTPVMFTISAAIWIWALFHYRLMDVVPIARDTVLQSMRDGVVALDAVGRIADLNPAALRFLGEAAGRRVGRPAAEAFAPYPGLMGLMDNKGEARAEVTLGEGSHLRRCDVLVSPLPDRRGRLRGRLVVLRDITEIRRAEQEQQRLEARMQQTQRLESLGVLAGGVAHTFSNLLTTIIANTDLAVRQMPEDSPARDRIRRAEDAAHRAAEITRQMLAYSGRGRFVVQPVSLTRVAGEMMPLLDAAVTRKATIQCELDPEVPLVQADEGQMRQILLNLVANASEALGARGGTIIVRTGSLNADRSLLAQTFPSDHLPEGRYAFLEVSDTGCGMDAETKARAFEPFFSTRSVGRGLGLPAVLGIVRGHGGTIRVTSEPGRGSRFLILLPPAAADEGNTSPASTDAGPKV